METRPQVAMRGPGGLVYYASAEADGTVRYKIIDDPYVKRRGRLGEYPDSGDAKTWDAVNVLLIEVIARHNTMSSTASITPSA